MRIVMFVDSPVEELEKVFINVLLREGSGSNILAVGPGARIVEVSQIQVDFTMFSVLIVLQFPLIQTKLF